MNRFLFLLIVLPAMNACKKEVALKDLSFDAVTASATVAAGETVRFDLSGNPDIISFYSGEIGNDYDSINGRVMPAELNMQFQSQILDGAQEDQFSVNASTDFSGDYTVEGVTAATWIDITGRFRIATPADNRLAVASGTVDISDLLVPGKPIYIGFHYINRPNAVYGRYNLWRFSSFQLLAVTPVATVTLASQSTAAWSIVLDGPWESGRVASTSSSFTFRGNISNTEVYQEAWGISRAFEAGSTVDMGPDRAVAIKAVPDLPRTLYEHVYTQPGQYKATFIAANQNAFDRKEIIKQINITVTP